MSYCPECGKQVAPTAKFCRNCGASQLEESPSNTPQAAVPEVSHACVSPGAGEREIKPLVTPAATPASPLTPPAAPAPVLSPLISCPVCGMPLNPGTRFCGGCGTPVKGDFIPDSPAPAAIISSPPPPPKYSPPPAQQPSPSPGIRLSRSCGYVINPGDKFCKKCLAKVVDVTFEIPAPFEAAAPPVSRHPPHFPRRLSQPSEYLPRNPQEYGSAGPVVM